jgi:cell division protein FtsW (lipid II flippase)
MNVYMNLYLAILFIAFVPGVLVTLPPKGGKYVVLAVHALLFVVVLHLTKRTVMELTSEGFQDGMPMNMPMNMNKKEGYQNAMNMAKKEGFQNAMNMAKKEGYQNAMAMMNKKDM